MLGKQLLATILYECTRHSLHDFLTDKARVSAALEDAVRAAVAPFAADVLSLQLADAEPPERHGLRGVVVHDVRGDGVLDRLIRDWRCFALDPDPLPQWSR